MKTLKQNIIIVIAFLFCVPYANSQEIINYFQVSDNIATPVTIKTSIGTFTIYGGERIDGNLYSVTAYDANGNKIVQNTPSKTETASGKPTIRYYHFKSTYNSSNNQSTNSSSNSNSHSDENSYVSNNSNIGIWGMDNSFAHNCKMCGDWSGRYSIFVPDPDPEGGFIEQQMKMVIRINSVEEETMIGVKASPLNNPMEIRYWNDCIVSNSTESSIEWTSFVRTSYDWNSSDIKNGSVIYKVDYCWVCSAVLNSGKLLMNYYLHSTYYDKQGNVIGIHNNPSENVILYK